MQKVKLGNYVEQIRGVSYKPTDLFEKLEVGSVILLRANNIFDSKVNFEDVVYVDKNKVKNNQFLRAGDILICTSSGSKDLVGKAAYIENDLNVTFGAFCKVIRPKGIESAFLGHFFQSQIYRHSISESCIGVNINNIRGEHIDNLEVPLPSLSEQKAIAEKLDKVSILIEKRKQQLSLLDTLVKSKFVEMVGDYELGTNKYKTKKLGDLSIKITDGVHAKPVYVEKGKPFLSVQNINRGMIDFTDCKFVSEEAYQKMIKSAFPEKGDVLYTKVGATYGISAYVGTDIPFCLYVSVCLIKPNRVLINSRFLSASMGMRYVKKQADRRVKGIGVPDLHLNQIREFDIILPPMEVQNKFVAFLEQIEKSKKKIKQSLAALELLKKSLMQKYFGG